MKHLYFTIFTILLLTSAAVSAQVTLSSQFKSVRVGDSVTIELRATTRDTLSTLQFSLAWNPNVLSFGRVDSIGGFPPSAEVFEYGLSNTALGKLSWVWIDRSNQGYRLPTDSFLIFKVVFKAIGTNGTNSPIQFTNDPTAMKGSNARFAQIATSGQSGNVQVGTTAIFEQNTEGVELQQNAPNPIDNQTVIVFSLREADNVALQIFNAQGQLVFEQNEFFSVGEHQIRLNTEGVLSPGFYTYGLRTRRGFNSKKLIKN